MLKTICKFVDKISLVFMMRKIKIGKGLAEKIFFLLWNHVENKTGTLYVELENKKAIRSCTIINRGRDNHIILQKGALLNNVHIYVHGNKNKIFISENSCIHDSNIEIISDEGSELYVGKNLNAGKNINFVAGEKGNIHIGDDCLFSHEITIRGNEGHYIYDLNNNIVNENKDVKIGDRVWIGENVKILKGVKINNDVVVGTSSVMTKGEYKGNAVYVGIPARMVKENIVWKK